MLKKCCSAVLPALLVCGLSFQAAADSHGKSPSPEEVVKRLGYSDAQIEQLKEGKIIAIDLERARGDQLIAAVAARIDAPLTTLSGNLAKGLNIERDPGVIAFGAIPDAAENYGFDKLSYDPSESSEIKRLLRVKANDTFNLGTDDIAALQEALKGVKADDAAAAETVSKAYRQVLTGRLNAYLKGGLDGIEPYDHGGSKFSPAEQLQTIYQEVEPFLSEFYPTFKDALGKFPQGQAPDISSNFYWIKREVEGRPAVILAHQLVQGTDDYFLVAQRQFFVGHTYESLQVVALGLPVEGGTAVFYVNTAFTDKVTGFFSAAAHSVGQGRMKDDLEAYFDEVRKAQ